MLLNTIDNNKRTKAAAYVRMSTEHQKYSPENQMAAINEYAEKHNYDIVEVYTDGGRSGLNISGRPSLQRMLNDVQSRTKPYQAILVLDVTRWGRFQDADESAYYEFICKKSGVKVRYCAEQFANDDSPVSTIVKSVKRTMAAEYSRELSCKVFAGQSRLITLGYKQGGPAGFGLRRMLIDEHGNQKGVLVRGEHKSIATDRVILVPGPEEEQEIVRWMYKSFIYDGKNEEQIANELNRRGVKTDIGRDWTRSTVKQVLTNEKYIGNNIFNRMSFKLKMRRVKNPEDMWVRKNNAFEGIVNPNDFFVVKGIFTARCRKLTDEEMLRKLRELQNKKGYLSAMVIDEAEDMPSSAAYSGRFGGLVRAYQLIGFDPGRDYKYLEINKYLRELHQDVVEGTIQQLLECGADIKLNDNQNLLMINDMFSVSMVVCRCNSLNNGKYRWKVRFDTLLNPDVTIAVRMKADNESVLDYYLLPSLDFRIPNIKLDEQNTDFLDSYRFANLEYLYQMAKCLSIRGLLQ